MEKRYVITIKIEKSILLFANSEEEARGKIQDYYDADPMAIETIKVEEVDSFKKHV